MVSAKYEFLTINRDKRKGPFVIRRMGHQIAHGFRTRKQAEEAAAWSERFVNQAIEKARNRQP